MSEEKKYTFATRDSKESVEQGGGFAPKFDEHGLIPAMAIDARTDEPLMLAYMNEESLKMTFEKGQAVYYSRSRKQLWHKGATSGEFQEIVEILTDCDQDALVLRVIQHGGGCCHTKRPTCFYRRVVAPKDGGQLRLKMRELAP
ncbi:MAG TPA: phosphoribosyl-AMP cyclohydrolase [Verrucomicrobiales bacterium]|nr:phosphoribosyl-AMP cyclohydrolase [Verrucomicrobiales bacterium]